MAIIVDESRNIFHLKAGKTSYVIGIVHGLPVHLYWGLRIREYAGSAQLGFYDRGFSPNPTMDDRTFSHDTLPLEYSTAHGQDFRPPSLSVEHADGGETCRFLYRSYRIIEGKPLLEGLPAVYVENVQEASTLELSLADDISSLELVLSYTAFARHNVICRHARLINHSDSVISLRSMLSCQVDFRQDDFEMVTLWGGHINEFNIQRTPVPHGTMEAGSRRGASSHQFSPFMALCQPHTNETQGEVYAMSFVYSGNFVTRTYRDQFGLIRMQMGINDSDFFWRLESQQQYTAPEVVMVFADEGLSGMSRTYHQIYRSRLARGYWRDRERPVLFNNWEATYFDFNGEILVDIAKKAAQLGVELFVLDDGWFGKRDNDFSGLATGNPIVKNSGAVSGSFHSKLMIAGLILGCGLSRK